jgi:DNA-binding NtrC family response regulator
MVEGQLQRSGKILIIDDEKTTLKNLERALKEEGYEVTTASSRVRALRILEGGEFDIVLADLKMKRVDGMQVFAKCRELYSFKEVILMTTFASLPSAIESMRQGAYYYLAKPFKLDEVRKVVKGAFEKAKLKKDNSREIENIIERDVALSNTNMVERGHLSEGLKESSIRTFRRREGRIPSLEEQEIAYIQWVLKEVGGNKTLAARTLGIDRVSLWRKLKKYGLEKE